MTNNLNEKHHTTFIKGQFKSKVDRIRQEYDAYKEAKDKSDVGIWPTTGKLTFPDKVWEELKTSKPKKIMSKNRKFRDRGFEH
ncbi:hypothetical protein PHMEG_00019119 [Phytophthora megakarya]|uniref:Myb/SANT-like domain-containing protein n=1 Tax=Phytophthora megakarya TaxID=4795 RepID=A0A225VSP0_9STRA|nr:hypothetical protein PHMEG_00019119 [Phytophthora megakarya]